MSLHSRFDNKMRWLKVIYTDGLYSKPSVRIFFSQAYAYRDSQSKCF